MADGVQIPVVVDIEGAFNEAAKRVKTAINPLQEAIESAPTSLFIDVKLPGEGKKVLIELFDEPTTKAKQFQIALDQVNQKIEKLAAKGGFSLNSGLKEEERQLLEAATLLERRLTGVGNEATAMTRVLSINMKQAEAELEKYTAQLDKMTFKMNMAKEYGAQGSFKSPIETSQYKRRAAEVEKINLKIAQTRQFLAACSVELDNITKGSKRAGIAIQQMASEAQIMAESWRRGEAYLQRYNASLGGANNRLGALIKGSAQLLALHAATRFVHNIREVTAEFEMQRVALGGIIQDTERAEKLFKQLKAAAIQSPFEIKDLVTYTKQLSAYRIETDKLFDVTMKLADVSAGLGVDMNRIILAYGQVRAASVLRGQELRQFTEAGIPLVELLADKFSELRGETVSTAEVFDLISKRAVSFSMIEEIFNDMTDAGGIFYKMQEKQSETLKGQWMKLKDAVSIMYDEIGNTKQIHSAMEDLLSLAMNLMQNWRETGRAIGSVVAAMVAYKVAVANARIASAALTATEMAEVSALSLNVVGRSRLIAALFGEAAATKAQIVLGNAYVAVKQREMMATNMFSKALYKMVAALLANPYAAAIAGAAALVAVLLRLTKTSQDTTISLDGLEKTMAQFDRAVSHARSTQGLIDVYEELSAKAEKTEKEQKQLNRVTNELAKTFPSAVSGIDKESGSLQINIDKVKALTKAELELEESRLRRDKKRAERRMAELNEERDKILKMQEMGGENVVLRGAAPIWREWNDTELADMGERLQEINTELETLGEKVEEINQMDFVGPLPKDIAEAQGMFTGWKKELSTIQEEKVKAGATRLFSDEDIQGFDSVLKFSKELKKKYDEVNQSLKTNKELLKTATEATKADIEANIKADEQTLKMIEAIKTALGILFKTTAPRDTRLSQLKSDISELTNAYKKFKELTKYKGEEEALIDIGKMFPQLEGWTPTKDSLVKKLNEMLDKVKSDLSRSPKSKTLLDMKRALETEISNLEFDDLKDKIETKLKNLQDEIKRSEAARNFYHNILDLTGDEKLSASLTMEVYGQTGKEFKERVQDEMLGALESAKDLMGKDFFDKMTEDIKIFNVKEIRSQLQLLPETIRPVFERLLNEQEKFDADWYQNYYKVYAKSKDYSDRLADNEKKRAQALKEARERGQDTAAVNAFYDKKAAEIQLEAMKDTYTWTKAFENLEGVSTYTLKNLIALIDEYIEKYAKDLEPQQLRELMRSRERAEAQLIERNAFEQLEDAISDYVKAREKKAKLDKDSEEGAEASAQAADDEADALDRASLAMDKAVGYINELASATKELLSAFASDKDASYYSEQIDNLTKSLAGAAQTAQGVMRMITSGGADPAAYVQTFTGVASFITGIVNAINAARIKKANDEIERQARAISDLEYAYGRLDKAIDDAFGNARIYNYNQQIEILKRKLDALNTQLDAERSKGNKASQDAINGYLDSIRETEAALADLQRLPAEFWAGQELTSASEAFVDSWIAAKKEFGDTASAIEDTMQEMVENLVSKAAMSGVVQAVLKPWYAELNKIKSWDASTIARMVQEAYNKIPAINQGLEIAYSSIAAAGVDIRRTVGNLTGISRNYATASEESILGLTAATNTQNYYMSYMPTINDHVAAIRARLVGDGGGDTAAAPEGPTYQDQMLIYASNLPLMRSDTEAIRSMLERVIKPAGTTATHYVSVRM